MSNNLKRFKEAQDRDYETALMEVKSGHKTSHWMWFIFPQIDGLGKTDIARHYAIKDIHEATEFLMDQELSLRLVNICKALLELATNDAYQIFGSPDHLKLKSSMTLFDAVPATFPVFGQVLDKFYGGEKDVRTLQLLGISAN
ncbi:DUF1810 domain-containing protein [Mucilaginibacter polytrichastri]|uniref:Calpastatin n=1 Tax=Mucilaginibacter polytrichastri TaxID=1302689 RepID=A0A1Q6A2D7_9SPHI|nr:DUF1810 domain-containing protein [Mucilaginibacter polytrichastri]OKS88151.1 hypothetical protein RG47T_3615 [Mucilaginibacter polytrichastri]SFT09153.1 Uncharacterized protein, DUF1810 family [Mucilaginibacter polytrichastri]